MDTDLMAAVWAADDSGAGASLIDIGWLLERGRESKWELLDGLNAMRAREGRVGLVEYVPAAGEDQPEDDVDRDDGLWKLTDRGRFEVLRR